MKRASMLLIAASMTIEIVTAQPAAISVENDGNTTAVKQTITMGDVKIIEATENIRLLSQKIAKEYLFLTLVKDKEKIFETLRQSLIRLGESLHIIAMTTKDSDTKDILEFLAYSKDQMAQLFTEEITEENVALMLDYSETLLEGADSIAKAHAYNYSKEERMLLTVKKMDYLTERIMKYYIALHVGFDTPTNVEQLKQAIEKFEEDLHSVVSYDYPADIVHIRSKMLESWRNNKDYIERHRTLFIPKLMLISTRFQEKLLDKIALYHNKNQ